ncbi:glycerate kinase [Corynebacterium mendelii]|uniref:Glycerate kinase n=1 Tax=Corynebacterium mendelii TaxID=2765362 RepID=A0A939E1C6_9CORY|nr:glycerate kinase [Corynebacterium mendelii]MBN9644013.1 glycerate kinase [Corynebacterium mendelii]
MATIVVAADSMKGSATAAEVVGAICRGWRRVRPDDRLVPIAMADGGEGTVDAFALAYPAGIRHELAVTAPCGHSTVTARWLEIPADGDRPRTAVVDVAGTCGIEMVDQLCPLTGSTRGLGETVARIIGDGIGELIIGIGSSCSTDGGAGFLQALGAQLTDAAGDPIGPGLAGLATLRSARLDGVVRPRGRVTVLTDVTNPLTGPTGAAHVFGPQKGLDSRRMPAADAALMNLCDLIGGRAGIPGAGAAGGLGMALDWWGASLVGGAGAVAALTGLDRAVAGADAVITGEGRFDRSSMDGKVVSMVYRCAAGHRVPVVLVCGSIAGEDAAAVFADREVLEDSAGSARAAMDGVHDAAATAGARLAERFTGGRRPRDTGHRE